MTDDPRPATVPVFYCPSAEASVVQQQPWCQMVPFADWPDWRHRLQGFWMVLDESGLELIAAGDLQGVRLTDAPPVLASLSRPRHTTRLGPRALDNLLARRGGTNLLRDGGAKLAERAKLLARACAVGRTGKHEHAVDEGASVAGQTGAAGKNPRRVVDATAGFGVDGLGLAALGAHVQFIEREPCLAALLVDFVRRSEVRAAVTSGDSRDWLPLAQGEVVYLDPMYPLAGKKSALPGKSLQYARVLTSPDAGQDAELLELARACASERVVVKRRPRDPSIQPCDWSVSGKLVRFDVYRTG